MKSATPHMMRRVTKAGHIKNILCVMLFTGSMSIANAQLINYVQPLSGTAPSSTPAALKHSEAGSEKNANTIPAVTLPFAMTQWVAQTRQTEIKCQPPYYYRDTMLSGFRGTHWLSGSCTQDYGSFTVMPVTGALRTRVKEYAVTFSHQQETTSPAYYSVELPAAHLKAEITSTLRCGIMQFTMQQDDSLYLLVIPNSDKDKGFVKVDRVQGIIWGYNPVHRIYQGWGEPAGFSGWFYIKVESSLNSSGTFSADGVFATDSILNKKGAGAFVGLHMRKGEQLRIRIGTSFSNLEGAMKNLQAEIATESFATVRKQSEKIWETVLSQVKVETKIEKDKRIFYTAMYHAVQLPRLMSDVNGIYPRFAGKDQLEKMQGSGYYDDFSMWDIYRAQLPLIEILYPQLANQLVHSLILKGQQGGWLPVFPCWNSYTAAMIGDHATAFIASAYNKGIRNYDADAAYKLMRRNAFETPADHNEYKNGFGRRALRSYLQYGFIPMEDSVQEAFHKKEQVSRTLEYAYDDYALSVVAKGLNKTADLQLLNKRALNYKQVFDTSVGMVRGRFINGNWTQSFHPDQREPYITEGTPRQYSFYVPQDVAGLSKLMGGVRKLEAALDSLFIKDEYWHGNEPGHQIPFMYNFTEAPYKTQQVVKKILAEEYSDGAGGLSGNDDAGQMSAWYMFAAMGFYPVDPVSKNYQLASPLFDKVSISLAGNKKFGIITHKRSLASQYIYKVLWKGKSYDKNYITWEMLQQGGMLDIFMQDKPSSWGALDRSRAPSLSKE